MPRSKLLLFVCVTVGLVLAAGVGFATARMFPAREVKRVHVLSEPLVVTSQTGRSGVLPAGTALEYDSSFPEGFDRFRVVLNYEGEHLQLHEANPPDLTDPLSSFGLQPTSSEVKRTP